MRQPTLTAMDGWALPPGSRTWHAYAGAWSLCRRQSPAPAGLRQDPGEPMCLACRKAAMMRRAMIGVDRVELSERAEAPAWTPPAGQRPPRRRRGGR